MRPIFRFALPLALCLSPVMASALDLQPGVWEVSSHNMQVGGQAMPGMEEMLAQMQNLPPEQRQMMENMMAEQGIKLGAGGVQMCLTAEQIKAQEIPCTILTPAAATRFSNAARRCGNSASTARMPRAKGRRVSSATRNSPPRSKALTTASRAAWKVEHVG